MHGSSRCFQLLNKRVIFRHIEYFFFQFCEREYNISLCQSSIGINNVYKDKIVIQSLNHFENEKFLINIRQSLSVKENLITENETVQTDI